MTLTRRARDSDSTEMTRAHHCKIIRASGVARVWAARAALEFGAAEANNNTY